jgi:stringent starvation protein B
MFQVDTPTSSTRPYLIRAIYEWCTDNGLTPYLAVYVDETVSVPMEHVKNSEIVLNISFDATSGLKLGNDFIEFKARFSGTAREIHVPVDHVISIYARENGQGMAFPVQHFGVEDQNSAVIPFATTADATTEPTSSPATASPSIKLVSTDTEGKDSDPPPEPPKSGPRPALKRIK